MGQEPHKVGLGRRRRRARWTEELAALRAAQRDPLVSYNPYSRADLAAKAPGLDWDAFLAAAGLQDADLILVSDTAAVAGAAQAASQVPLADWRDYLAYRAIRTRGTIFGA